MTDNPRRWTDIEVLDNMRIPSRLNRARQKFSSWSGLIEQAGQQRMSPTELRRMEFEAVVEIITAYGEAAYGESP